MENKMKNILVSCITFFMFSNLYAYISFNEDNGCVEQLIDPDSEIYKNTCTIAVEEEVAQLDIEISDLLRDNYTVTRSWLEIYNSSNELICYINLDPKFLTFTLTSNNCHISRKGQYNIRYLFEGHDVDNIYFDYHKINDIHLRLVDRFNCKNVFNDFVSGFNRDIDFSPFSNSMPEIEECDFNDFIDALPDLENFPEQFIPYYSPKNVIFKLLDVASTNGIKIDNQPLLRVDAVLGVNFSDVSSHISDDVLLDYYHLVNKFVFDMNSKNNEDWLPDFGYGLFRELDREQLYSAAMQIYGNVPYSVENDHETMKELFPDLYDGVVGVLPINSDLKFKMLPFTSRDHWGETKTIKEVCAEHWYIDLGFTTIDKWLPTLGTELESSYDFLYQDERVVEDIYSEKACISRLIGEENNNVTHSSNFVAWFALNFPPVLKDASLSPIKSQYQVGEILTFSGNIFDVNNRGDDVRYTVKVNGQIAEEREYTTYADFYTDVVLSHTLINDGVFQVEFCVENIGAYWHTHSTTRLEPDCFINTITVVPAPIKPVVTFNQSTYEINERETLEIGLTASDEDGKITSINWSTGESFPYNTSSTPSSITRTFTEIGTHIITACAIDNDGLEACANVTVVVLDIPEPPVVELTVAKEIVLDGEAFEFTVDAFDPDGVISSIRWYSTHPFGITQTNDIADPTQPNTQSETLTVVKTFYEQTDKRVYVCATDNKGLERCDNKVVSVFLEAPTLSYSNTLPSEYTQGAPLNIEFNVTDNRFVNDVTVDYGDGTIDTFTLVGKEKSFSVNHSYQDVGWFDINICAVDISGLEACLPVHSIDIKPNIVPTIITPLLLN